jgi:hypothetical protein
MSKETEAQWWLKEDKQNSKDNLFYAFFARASPNGLPEGGSKKIFKN